MTSKLDQAVLAITDAVVAAKEESAKAKKLAENPNVTASLDEEGRLKLNDNTSDIHLYTRQSIRSSRQCLCRCQNTITDYYRAGQVRGRTNRGCHQDCH